MRRFAFVLLLAAAPVTAANAQNMPLNQFLAKATALEKKGPMALLSSDLGRLKKEIENSAKQLRAERLAAKAAGRPQTRILPSRQSRGRAEGADGAPERDPARPARHAVQAGFQRPDDQEISLPRLRFSPAIPAPAAA